MGLAKAQQAGRRFYGHMRNGLHTVDAIIHKAAHVYSLAQPLLRQSYDTRILDSNLLDGYVKYQQARQLTQNIDRIVNV